LLQLIDEYHVFRLADRLEAQTMNATDVDLEISDEQCRLLLLELEREPDWDNSTQHEWKRTRCRG